VKRVLKIILVLLLAFSCVLVTGCSCFPVSEKQGFFTNSKLKSEGLEGLEKPNYDYVDYSTSTPAIYGMIEYSTFEEYAEYLFNFLTERYEYVGFNGGTKFTLFTYNGTFVNALNNIANCRKEDEISVIYEFLYFTEKDLKRSDGVPGFTHNFVKLVYLFTPQDNLNFAFSFPNTSLWGGRFYYNDSYLDPTTLNVEYVLEPYKKEKGEFYDHNFSYRIDYYESSSYQGNVKDFINTYANNFGTRKSPLVSKVLEYEPEYFKDNFLSIQCAYLPVGKNAKISACWMEDKNTIYVRFEFYDDPSITERMNLYAIIKLPNNLYENYK
jgi:hypothetical protein